MQPRPDYRFDPYSGQQLSFKFDPYSVRPLYGLPIAPRTLPSIQPRLNQTIQPPYQNQTGIEGELNRFIQPVFNNIYGGQSAFNAGPTVIDIDPNGVQKNGGPQPCQNCKTITGQTVRRKIGGTALGWGVCLWVWTGILCWMPCGMDGCKDAELVCVKCNQVKSLIHAPICC